MLTKRPLRTQLNNILGALTLLVSIGANAYAQSSDIPADSLRARALRATVLDARRQLASATPATIDSLIALYSDSVSYEHPNAHVVLHGKDVLKKSMADYIGSVRAVNADAPRITIGAHVAIVETRATMEINDKGKWVAVTRHGIRVLEFDARGLVRRMLDYPW